MDPSPSHLDSSALYYGKENVTFGKGNIVPISDIGRTSIWPKLTLSDVLIEPNLRKNLLLVNNLTSDKLVDVLFSQTYFAI